jgi:hypothetical protein
MVPQYRDMSPEPIYEGGAPGLERQLWTQWSSPNMILQWPSACLRLHRPRARFRP